MLIWRVDLHSRMLRKEPVPPEWRALGGRGLIARILLDELSPETSPLSPGNKLIFTPGLLCGYRISSCDRVSVGVKSPMTGGIKESNAGGTTGLHMARLGMKALIIENSPAQGWWLLHLHDDQADFLPADDLINLGVYQTASMLRERFGSKAAISIIGPAGERQYLAAGIANLDKDGVPSRFNARGGVGAVMGSKRIKAIIFDGTNRPFPQPVDPVGFKTALKFFLKELMDHPQTAVYHDFGTAGVAQLCNRLGALPTHNFHYGQNDQVEQFSGETLRQTLLERPGRSTPTHACMPGCVIQCSNVYCDENGEEIVAPLEYETIGLMGSNLDINNLDDIARLNHAANDLGVDTIDLGAALGLAAEAGLFQFGDVNGALALIDEIWQGTQLGTALGGGAAATGKALGTTRIPAVKGQALSAYDPRAIKGTGITYATSPQGGDHTSGLTIRARVNHLDPAGQKELSINAQKNMAGYDTLGACSFAGFGFAAAQGVIRDLLNTIHGWDVSDNILQDLGNETLILEHRFNRLHGLTPADDRLPDWLLNEPLHPNNSVFDVPQTDLDATSAQFTG